MLFTSDIKLKPQPDAPSRKGLTPIVILFLIMSLVLLQGFVKAEDELTAEYVLATLPLSDSERKGIFNGEIGDWVHPAETSNRELSVGGALIVQGKTPEDLLQHFRKAAEYKIVPFVTGFGEIKEEGTIDDFQDLVLEPYGLDEAHRYLTAEGGDTLNLSPEEIALFQDLNQSVQKEGHPKEKVEKLLRGILLARYQDYRTKGLAGLAPYERNGALFCPGKELAKTSKVSLFIKGFFKPFYDYFLHYPSVVRPSITLPRIEERFYWANLDVFKRPTLVLGHRASYKISQGYIFMDRHFYSSHDYNIMKMTGGYLNAKGGTLAVYYYRVSTDRVVGFGSWVKRPVARRLMKVPIVDLFRELRNRVVKK